MDVAISRNHTDLIELLKDPAEEALFKAVKEGDLVTLKRLVADGVNLEAKDDKVNAAPPAEPSLPGCTLALRPRYPAPVAPPSPPPH